MTVYLVTLSQAGPSWGALLVSAGLAHASWSVSGVSWSWLVQDVLNRDHPALLHVVLQPAAG